MSVLFVQQISIHHSRSDVDEKSLRAALKADYGYDGRRLSRFTLNALAAALPIGSAHHSPESGVYLGARFSSPAKFDNMLAVISKELMQLQEWFALLMGYLLKKIIVNIRSRQ